VIAWASRAADVDAGGGTSGVEARCVDDEEDVVEVLEAGDDDDDDDFDGDNFEELDAVVGVEVVDEAGLVEFEEPALERAALPPLSRPRCRPSSAAVATPSRRTTASVTQASRRRASPDAVGG